MSKPNHHSMSKPRVKACRNETRELIISILPRTISNHNGDVNAAFRELATAYCVETDFISLLYNNHYGGRSQTFGTHTTTTTAYMSQVTPSVVNHMNFLGGPSQGAVQSGQSTFPSMLSMPSMQAPMPMQPNASAMHSQYLNIQPNPSFPHPEFAYRNNSPTGNSLAGGLSLGSSIEMDGQIDDLSADFASIALESPPPIKLGKIDFDEIKHGREFLDLVNSPPFWKMLSNYNNKHCKTDPESHAYLVRHVSEIGGGHSEVELYSHPDVIRDKYQRDGSLLEVPVSLSDFVKPMRNKFSSYWTSDTTTEFWIEFTNKWEEENPGEEIISLLLLCSDGLHHSAQDIHIDVGQGGGQFTLSVSYEKVLRTVAYPNHKNCFSNGGLHNCLSFLSEWNVEQDSIKLLQEKLHALFTDIKKNPKLLKDGWNSNLWNNSCGALLHQYNERENNGEYETGQYLSMKGPIPHRAPTVTPPDESEDSDVDGKAKKRPIMFGVWRKKGTNYVYDYDEQMTPPELIAMLLETLWPCLDDPTEPNSKAKASLLYLFVSSLYRSNDLKTEWARFVEQKDTNGYQCSIAVMEKLLKEPGVMKSDKSFVIAPSNDRLVESLEKELMGICNENCKEGENAMSTDEE